MARNPLLQMPANPLLPLMAEPGAQPMDPFDYSGRFNTALSPPEEAAFQQWAAANKRAADTYDYDLRGFWKSGGQFADNGHGADRFKKPNHPTFSDQSQYHGPDFQGGTWGRDSFTPSPHNLQMMSPGALQEYFRRREPDMRLLLPGG